MQNCIPNIRFAYNLLPQRESTMDTFFLPVRNADVEQTSSVVKTHARRRNCHNNILFNHPETFLNAKNVSSVLHIQFIELA